MIELTDPRPGDVVTVEFDDDAPVTLTWPRYTDLQALPVYVGAREGRQLLELKFDGEDGRLIELVLVNAPDTRRIATPWGGSTSDASVSACWTGDDRRAELPHLDVIGYDDVLMMHVSPGPAVRWFKDGPVLYGTADDSSVVSFGVPWDAVVRDRIIGSR
ncbi:hypothetical protein ATJ88_0383 [Isoptericola jiangsuensis]|uniref:Uncharacterized protein n=1 Tax=Isoptericola jiangsuensis TaxID=548579 RepID=A0A2A9ET79_9MICO|nr:hypothetical protein [Isoptericola jiangsuensis]PFG41741.1 hypothetical protein ATJ88_0383 [Isoptericola jiangsuensis]